MEATKLELMQMLLDTQRENVLVQLKEVFEKEKAIDVKIQQEMIESAERANEDIKAGNVYTPEEVEGLLEKRFAK